MLLDSTNVLSHYPSQANLDVVIRDITVPHNHKFIPLHKNNDSNWLHWQLLGLITPFWELRFDQLAEMAINGQTTLEEVSSLKFITSLSCPL
jgi:hypothetical protein